MHSMSKNTYLWTNVIVVIIPVVAMFWVYPNSFFEDCRLLENEQATQHYERMF